MIFVDTNVIMYAVGRSHPLKSEAREFFEAGLTDPGVRLCTSAEVLQELMHAYVTVDRIHTLDAAFTLVDACIPEVWDVTKEDIHAARFLVDAHGELGARDLLHFAMCDRRRVSQMKTFDRALRAAFDH
ncbi:MAG: type II toxin-antitoxin system VapC family toxin [Deltaproteobacteria bacterium]|nr:type II toxin-antitoxin system VapC family toxin [Deltaproteobacteria bacterium]